MSSIDRRRVLGLRSLVFCSALLLASAASGEAPRFGEETLSLELGTFLSDFDTEVALKGPNGGASIDARDEQ